MLFLLNQPMYRNVSPPPLLPPPSHTLHILVLLLSVEAGDTLVLVEPLIQVLSKLKMPL